MFLRTTSMVPPVPADCGKLPRCSCGTGQVRQRHIASLGRLDRLLEDDGLKGLIDGLLKVSGRGGLDELVPGVTDDNTQFEPARTVGALWAVCQLCSNWGWGGGCKADSTVEATGWTLSVWCGYW